MLPKSHTRHVPWKDRAKAPHKYHMQVRQRGLPRSLYGFCVALYLGFWGWGPEWFCYHEVLTLGSPNGAGCFEMGNSPADCVFSPGFPSIWVFVFLISRQARSSKPQALKSELMGAIQQTPTDQTSDSLSWLRSTTCGLVRRGDDWRQGALERPVDMELGSMKSPKWKEVGWYGIFFWSFW